MPVYLKYGDVKGDVTEPGYSGWIELISTQWGVRRAVPGPTGGSSSKEQGSSTVREIVVVKTIDSASVRLQNEAISGNPVSAVIDFVRDDGSVSLRLEMAGTTISGWSISSGGDNPTETLTLNFTKVEFKNTPGTPPP